MNISRRPVLQMLCASALIGQAPWLAGCSSGLANSERAFQLLEEQHLGRLGIAALDTHSGRQLAFRGQERFALCSTFKLVLAGAILARAQQPLFALNRTLHYSAQDMVSYSPITEQHLQQGMSIGALCAATLQYSDNTAANLLMRELGGPHSVTAFARQLGDRDFQLERWETELNTAIPGDPRDTTTPAAMLHSLQQLTLGNALTPAGRAQLNAWLLGNTTGDKRIRAALPNGWTAGDKTGSGAYGTSNDIAIIFPPARKPIVLTVYFTQAQQNAAWNNAVIQQASQIALQQLGHHV